MKNLIKKILKEDYDFSFTDEIGNSFNGDICEAYNIVNVGDVITVDSYTDINYIRHNDIKCTVLWKGNLKKLDPTNVGNESLLVYVHDSEFIGFEDEWMSDWTSDEMVEKCRDYRCTYLICGLEEDEDVVVSTINEDLDFSFTDDIYLGLAPLEQMLNECKDVPFFNVHPDGKPFTKKGKPNYYYVSSCPYWWDRLKGVPDSIGRDGWFENPYDGKKLAIIMPDRDVEPEELRNLSNDEFSAITYGTETFKKFFEGGNNHEWNVLRGIDGKPDYTHTPEWMVKIIKPELDKYFD